MKIVLINHTFQEERFYKRWRLLSETHEDLDIYLLAPKEYKWGGGAALTYGKAYVQEGKTVESERFHIRLIRLEKHRYSSWTSADMVNAILEIKPDIVYHIGEHTQDSLMQLLDLKKSGKLPDTKFVAFSMRGHQHALKLETSSNPLVMIRKAVFYFVKKNKIKKLNKYCDAIFCHYPDGRDEFIREGYKGPIYMQTQVGVDTDIFHTDEEARRKIREKYNIGDAYLFGSASRFNASKGLSEIIAALPEEGNWKYLMMGHGRDDEVEKIKSEIAARGLEDKIILTGYIDNWTDMAQHWNALDCAVHMPLTTPKWEETFSLALVQAMATSLPVIGSSSGSVPYQIGPDGIVLPEGDIEKMRETFVHFMNNPDEGKAIGEKMKERAFKCFDIRPLNELFYRTIVDVKNGVHDENKTDMASYWD